MAYIGLFLSLNIYYIFLYSCRRHNGMLANSNFRLQVLIFYWYQSSLLVNCDNSYWWALSKRVLEYKVDFNDVASYQCLLSYSWPVIPLWISPPICFCSAILKILILCHQQHKIFLRLAFFISHSKIIWTGVGHRSYKWKLGRSIIRKRMIMKMKNWVLLSWH